MTLSGKDVDLDQSIIVIKQTGGHSVNRYTVAK